MAVIIKPFIKSGNIKKDGTSPIYILVRIDNKDRLYNTGKYVIPGNFDHDRCMVRTSAEGANKLNRIIDDIRKKYTDVLLQIELEGKLPTHQLIDERVNGTGTEKGLIEFCEKELEIGKDLISQKHYHEMKLHIAQMKAWGGEVNINLVDLEYLEKYQQHMIRKGNKTNTISAAFRTIRRFYNIAIRKGETTNYPFKHFRIRYEETNKEYLTMDELSQLDELFYKPDLSSRLRTTLYYFLIGCYTGLRMQDCRDISKMPVNNGMITRRTIKRKKIVHIPVSTRTAKLLETKISQPLKQSDSRVNEDLEDIMDILKIKKHITFHCSRHTFAVNSLILGIPIEVVSDILGHTSLKTTQIYAKIVNEYKVSQMKKWDQ